MRGPAGPLAARHPYRRWQKTGAMTGMNDAEIGRDVRQAWDDLLAAARDAGYAVEELIRPPASAGQVAAAEDAIGRRLPTDLAELYLLSDGQVDWWDLVHGPDGDKNRRRGRWAGSLFGDGWTFDRLDQLQIWYRGWAEIRAYYTPEELAEDFDFDVVVRGDDPVKPLYTSADWIPFATDGGGNSLAADLAPEPGGTAGQVIVIGSDEDTRRVVAPSVLALLRLCAGRLRDPAMIPEPQDGVALYSLAPGLNGLRCPSSGPELGRYGDCRGMRGLIIGPFPVNSRAAPPFPRYARSLTGQRGRREEGGMKKAELQAEGERYGAEFLLGRLTGAWTSPGRMTPLSAGSSTPRGHSRHPSSPTPTSRNRRALNRRREYC
jgi:cell wall assembly regulator SMI1